MSHVALCEGIGVNKGVLQFEGMCLSGYNKEAGAAFLDSFSYHLKAVACCYNQLWAISSPACVNNVCSLSYQRHCHSS